MTRISALPAFARAARALDAHEREERAFGDLGELTAREREVLALLAQGLSDRGIANRLWLTSATVETHIRHILGKLMLPNDAHQNRRVPAVLIYLRERDEGPWRSGVTTPCRVGHATTREAPALAARCEGTIVADQQWPTSGLTLVLDGD